MTFTPPNTVLFPSEATSFLVLVLCGLPGAGKSTLAAQLMKKYGQTLLPQNCENCNDNELNQLTIHHICYDTFYKKEMSMADNCNNCTIFDAQKWKDSRMKAYATADEILRMKTSNIFNIIIIDDNMFYRSMRYSYFKLCQNVCRSAISSISISFGIIFVDTEKEECISRNIGRNADEFVSEAIIDRMNDRIQAPNANKYSFERNSFVYHSKSDQKSLIHFISNAWKNGKIEIKIESNEDCQQREKDREMNLRNIKHQIDIRTRKIMGKWMKMFKNLKTKGKIPINMKDISRQLNYERKTQIILKSEFGTNLDLQMILEKYENQFEDICLQIFKHYLH